MSNWFGMEASEVVKAFGADIKHGLTNAEALKRSARTGPNQLQEVKKGSVWQIFGEQFTDFMVLVLIGAAIVSFLLGERADALTILAIIVLNAILGFIQEYRAERSLAALKELTAPLAHVLRNGKIERIPAKELVPGDILVLESGARIPADARLIETIDLEVNEATLTGESLAVMKHTGLVNANRPAPGDQFNMVFAGTVVTNGRGRGVVTAIGMETEIGKIANLIDTSQIDATPLQKKLEQLGRWLVLICLGICAAVASIGILRGEPPRQMFMAAVSLAVAAIPEGLPAIVTIALAIGVQKMIKRRAIIRKLPAVETLGCATVICSDKTGTLTQNKLAVTRLWAGGTELNLSRERTFSSYIRTNEFQKLLEIAVLCNNAQLDPDHGQELVYGDPTEGALLSVGLEAGADPGLMAKTHPRRRELPFSSERKRMSVWVDYGTKGMELMIKGAADVILGRCDRILTAKGIEPLTQSAISQIKQRVEEWGANALRVLAFAYRPADGGELNRKAGDPETALIWTGLIGMTDPPRPESRLAIARCKKAGIRTKMITGDYSLTAAAVAKEIGLLRPAGRIVSGTELDSMSDTELTRQIKAIDVFARVSPHHKLRIVKALKQNGEIVAMTGDGVNDAPAVKEANIGVAMGQNGTDVTKEASAMVIADDNFATIVAAVEEGRAIYENIRKFIRYLLSCNTGEILTIFGGIMLGLPFPLLPIQILWVNLVTDGLPAIALGMEPAEPGIMQRPPRDPHEGIFSRGLGWKIVFQGVAIGAVTLFIYLFELKTGVGIVKARTAAFGALVFAQLFFVFQCRSESHSMLQMNPLQNLYLLGAVLISGGMQILVMFFAPLQKIFYTSGLNLVEWLLILTLTGFSAVICDFIFRFRSRIRKHLTFFRWEVHRLTNQAGK